MATGQLTVFKSGQWYSKTHDDGKYVRDLVALVKGKEQLKGRSSVLILHYITDNRRHPTLMK